MLGSFQYYAAFGYPGAALFVGGQWDDASRDMVCDTAGSSCGLARLSRLWYRLNGEEGRPIIVAVGSRRVLVASRSRTGPIVTAALALTPERAAPPFLRRR